jgi:hypothetical protein
MNHLVVKFKLLEDITGHGLPSRCYVMSRIPSEYVVDRIGSSDSSESRRDAKHSIPLCLGVRSTFSNSIALVRTQ